MERPLVETSPRRKRKVRWLWLLLLIPAGFLFYYLYTTNQKPQVSEDPIEDSEVLPEPKQEPPTGSTSEAKEILPKPDKEVPTKNATAVKTAPPAFRRISAFPMSDSESQTDYIIAGRVMTEAVENPLSEALLIISGRRHFSLVPTEPLAHAASDSAGNYEIYLHSPLSGMLTVRKEGYAEAQGLLDLQTPGITIRNFRLRKADAAIEGYVRDQAGKPLQDVEIAPYPDPVVAFADGTALLPGRILTDSNGFYRVANLPSGGWRINVAKNGYLKQAKNAILDSEQSVQVDFELESASTLSFLVKNRYGEIIPARAVTPSSSSYLSTTDEAGTITISLPTNAGPFLCRIGAPDYREKELTINPQSPPEEVVLDDAGRLRGRVLTTSGLPIQDVYVGWSDIQAVATDPTGEFQIAIPDLPASIDLRLLINKPGFVSQTLSFSGEKWPDFLEIRLQPSEGGIYGRVFDEAGKPVTRYYIRLVNSESDREEKPPFTKFVADIDGLFFITEAPAGTYQMSVSSITDPTLDQVLQKASLPVEIREGYYFGEILVELSSSKTPD